MPRRPPSSAIAWGLTMPSSPRSESPPSSPSPTTPHHDLGSGSSLLLLYLRSGHRRGLVVHVAALIPRRVDIIWLVQQSDQWRLCGVGGERAHLRGLGGVESLVLDDHDGPRL